MPGAKCRNGGDVWTALVISSATQEMRKKDLFFSFFQYDCPSFAVTSFPAYKFRVAGNYAALMRDSDEDWV